MDDAELAEIRAKVGTVVATYEFPSLEIAGAAFAQLEKRARLISVWRHGTVDRDRWMVTVMGEETQAPQIAAAETRMRRHGGRRIDDPDPGMIEAFRERRWQSALAGARAQLAAGGTGTRPTRQRAHYGRRGVILGTDGQIRPSGRPQG